MTPPPSTAAATGHARSLRRSPGTRAPRRVSGPSRAAGGARAARAAAAAAAAPRAARLRPAPRRAAASGGAATVPLPLVARLGALVESRWLDRLLRGRAWIVVIAVGLIGLVFLQVSLLKLNAGIGAAVQRAAELERANADLSADISKLASNDRIQQLATRAGMVLPPSSEVSFLGKGGRRVGGDAAAVPSEAEATTATLPTAPTTDGELATAAPAAADPSAPAAEPQTTTSVPLTPEQRAEQQAAGAAAAATADPAASGAAATAAPPADAAADTSTGGAAVGGAAAGG